MFAYSPSERDRSGDLIAAGMMGAAQTQAEAMGNIGENIGGIISQFAGAYAADKALKAKGAAYGEFLKNHGEQLGLNGEYLNSLLKKDPRELAMIGDNVVGMPNAGRSLMALNYQQQTANLFPRNRGTGGGMGSGTAAPQESVTF